MDYREHILELAKASPLQPTNLGKLLGKDSLMASAMLSEMSSKGLLKISSMKVGSSPLYYSPEHPEHLLNYLQSLNEKDRQAVEFLKEKKIVRESELSPLQKVCMRNIKDFAMPLEVSSGEVKEVFWKWFLLSDGEAGELIKTILDIEPITQEVKEELKLEQIQEVNPEVEEKPETHQESIKEEIKEELRDIPVEPRVEPEKPKAKLKKTKVKPKPVQTEQEKTNEEKEEELDKEINTVPGKEIQKSEPQKTIGPVFVDMGDPFLKKIKSFFDNNQIVIHEVNTIKKKTEFDLVIEIPTPLGNLCYFCKAKNNKRISNSDLSTAFVQGQLKKIPVIFLSPGILTKPAEIFMKDLKGLTVTRL